ncbi:hypothetical protein P0Y35_16965 [Kiritimatiellaeota bacterium B1221]|nr:hypothetical protein [Kiritimatiellaeota bacterium B1221]
MRHKSPSSLFFLIVFAMAFHFHASAELKVLFIGNSFTIGGGKSVPTIFDALANAAGQEDPTTVMRAVGGKDYKYHYQNSLSHIQSDQWTHVVLQNYSTGPTHIGNIPDHMTYGGLLYDAIIANNPDTHVHLYQTWARAEAHSLIGTSFATTDEMLGELVTNYQALADALNQANPDKAPVIVNPVGEAWNLAGGNLPASDPDYIDLWASDNYHGDNRGYYLSACVHYASIYKQSPEGLYSEPEITALSLSISSTDAAHLETTAWRIVTAKGLVDQILRVDFGSDANPTPDSETAWNNLSATQGSDESTVLQDLQDIHGSATPIDLSILSRFNAARSGGSSTSTLYPAEATSDSLYGNTEEDNGLSNLNPQFKLSGLDPSQAYKLSFYASAPDSGDNLQTRYTLWGDRTLSVDLDAAGNIDARATSPALYPDASGEITVSITPGPDNDSPTHLTLLGVLELTAYQDAAITFTTHPQSQSVDENNPVTFSAEVSANRFTTYQWYRNGIPIDGATDASYTLNFASAAHDGSLYTVIASNGVFEIESNPATLTLHADTMEPEFLALSKSGGSILQLSFSEPMDPATATDPANYWIANRGKQMQVTDITLSEDGTTVEITLEATPSGNIVVESSSQLTDRSGNPLPESSVRSIVTPTNGETLLLDFGNSYTLTSPDATWNEFTINSTIRTAVGHGTGTPHEYSASLLDTAGTPSGITFTMTDTMTGTNTAGSASGPYPSGATRDNFFGNTGDWSGFTDNGQGVFVFSNLNADKVYDFTFYASRTGASENRETRYALTGSTSGSADLNPANNDSSTVSITDISPDASGQITLTISDGTQNNHPNKFYYLSVLEIQIRDASQTPTVYPPVLLPSGIVVDWTGDGSLYTTEDLSLPWTEVDPAPTQPYLAPHPSGNHCYYKLQY